MNFNDLKLFLRQLKKQGIIGYIKTIGLVLGMLSALFILEYVVYQRSFDKGHGENVYRIVYNRYGREGLMWRTANFFVPAGPYLKNKYPEVEDYVTLRRLNDVAITYSGQQGNNTVINFDKVYYATASIFSLFNYPIVTGAPDGLEKPYTVALSENTARLFFGQENAIGKTILLNHRTTYTVTMVYHDLPLNNHLQSDLFLSYQTLLSQKPALLNDWGNDGSNAYIKLKPGTNYKDFQSKFVPVMTAEHFAEMLGKQNIKDEIYLQPVRSIHLDSHLEYELEPPGNGKIVSLLFYFSIFFLLIAWINTINLDSARSIERAREIGVKRANGSSKLRLIGQFMSEALVYNLISFAITLVVYLIIDPLYRNATGIPHDITVFDHRFRILFASAILLGVLLSSVYPSFILSSFKPVEVLRGRFVSSHQGYLLRKVLVTFQFILTILFIAGTIVTYKQVDFLMKKDFGISYQSKLVIKAPKRAAYGSDYSSKMELLIDRMLQNPEITDYTFCSDVPGKEIFGFFGGYLKGQTENELNWYFGIHADHRFASCFGANIVAGRTFREDDHPDARSMMINEMALKRFGFTSADEAVGKPVIGYDQKEYQIIGVYKDFHYYSAKIAPVATCFTNQVNQRKFLVLKFTPGSQIKNERTLNWAKQTFREVFPDQPFDYFYLPDLVANDLKPDKTFVTVFSLFSFLALIIALIGIIGLLVVFTIQNMKAFGMRKVLGAETGNFYFNMAKPFIPELAVAIVIGVPLAYWGLHSWITQNYISTIEFKAIYFLAPVIIVMATLGFVLLWITLKTYRMNVIEVISYE